MLYKALFTVQSILYTIYVCMYPFIYVCIYYTLRYICIYIYLPIFLLFSNSFEATQRNALICRSVHFILLLIRPCAASRPHIHWLTHTNAYAQVYIHTYLYTYLYMCIHICMSRDPAFAMVAALAYTYYTYGTLVVPLPLYHPPLYPRHTPTPRAHTLLCPALRLGLGRGLGLRLLLSSCFWVRCSSCSLRVIVIIFLSFPPIYASIYSIHMYI